jgi:hypothetical protein
MLCVAVGFVVGLASLRLWLHFHIAF